jgi:hypothetical protein
MNNEPPNEDRNNMGFPVIPFAVLWPLVRLVFGPLFWKVLPTVLRKIADAIDSGQIQMQVMSEEELLLAIESQKDSMKAVYKGN